MVYQVAVAVVAVTVLAAAVVLVVASTASLLWCSKSSSFYCFPPVLYNSVQVVAANSSVFHSVEVVEFP